MSKVQGTVISAGSELERLITEKVDTIEDLDAFLRKDIMHSFAKRNAGRIPYRVSTHFVPLIKMVLK